MIFQNWSFTSMHYILFFMQHLTLKRGEIIYKQNDEATNIYFILEGEVEFS